jgi:hypothetical protein
MNGLGVVTLKEFHAARKKHVKDTRSLTQIKIANEPCNKVEGTVLARSAWTPAGLIGKL